MDNTIKMKPGFYYFTHPLTAKDDAAINANFELCCKRSAELLMRGYNIYSPIAHSYPIEYFSNMLAWPQKKRWQFWLDIDFKILQHCNFTGVILAPKWHKSRGCLREYDWFLTHVNSSFEPYEILKYEDIVGD